MDASELRSLLRERPVVADGGMGSLIYHTLGYPPALCMSIHPVDASRNGAADSSGLHRGGRRADSGP